MPGRVSVIVTGHKTGDAYYTKGGTVYAGESHTRKCPHDRPSFRPRGSVATLNADETLMAGAFTEGGPRSAYVDPSRTAP